MENPKILRLKVKMQDPKGILIPKGQTHELTADIADEAAIFYFNNSATTKRFALLAMKLEKARGVNETLWIERTQKAVTKYEGKTKEEIRDLLLLQFKQMGLNAKNG